MSEETTTLEDKVKAEIENIRPFIQGDGGDIEFVDLSDKTVKVKLKGACAGCPGAQMTLKMGVERRLRETCDEAIVVESA